MSVSRRFYPLTALLFMGWAGSAYAISPILREIEDAFIRIGEQVRPAVVNIDCEQDLPEGGDDPRLRGFEPFFRFYGIPFPEEGESQRGRRRPPVASGSGFIYDKQGHVVTNNHVVSGAGSIKVRFHDGKEYEADLVAGDEDTDIAVIKLKGTPPDVHVAELGDSDGLKVGQFAIAVGNPRGLEGSLSFGHVSALGREDLRLPIDLRFQNFIQTDAAINLGNSGGPLCDIEGKVIGINTAIDAVGESLGFAIPVNMVKEVVPQLISNKKVVRGFLGVYDIRDLGEIVTGQTTAADMAEALGLPDPSGAYVNGGSTENSPAEKAGIKQGDVIRKVNGLQIAGAKDLVKRISAYSPGTTVNVEVWRDKQPLNLEVTLAEYAGSMVKARFGSPILGMRLLVITPELKKERGLAPEFQGLVVVDVERGSPAYEAEIGVGDIIVEIQQKPVSTVEDFRKMVNEFGQPGKSVLVRVLREGGESLPVLIKVPEEAKP
ncbi:MAG: putative periplasmic serine endoprotease DegP-like protein [Candidatus Hydrogenedentota bacterium]